MVGVLGILASAMPPKRVRPEEEDHADVILYLKFNSLPFVDDGPYGCPVTMFGTVSLDQAAQIRGHGCAKLGGGYMVVSPAAGVSFNLTGDFLIHGWIKPNTVAGLHQRGILSWGTFETGLLLRASPAMEFFVLGYDHLSGTSVLRESWFEVNEWTYFAIARVSSTIRLYFARTGQTTATLITSIPNVSSVLVADGVGVGVGTSLHYPVETWPGWMDAISVCRVAPLKTTTVPFETLAVPIDISGVVFPKAHWAFVVDATWSDVYDIYNATIGGPSISWQRNTALSTSFSIWFDSVFRTTVDPARESRSSWTRPSNGRVINTLRTSQDHRFNSTGMDGETYRSSSLFFVLRLNDTTNTRTLMVLTNKTAFSNRSAFRIERLPDGRIKHSKIDSSTGLFETIVPDSALPVGEPFVLGLNWPSTGGVEISVNGTIFVVPHSAYTSYSHALSLAGENLPAADLATARFSDMDIAALFWWRQEMTPQQMQRIYVDLAAEYL